MANDDYLNPIRRMVAKRREFRVDGVADAWHPQQGGLYCAWVGHSLIPAYIYDYQLKQWFGCSHEELSSVAQLQHLARRLCPTADVTFMPRAQCHDLLRAGSYHEYVHEQLTGQVQPITPPQVGDVRWDGAVWTGRGWRSK